MILNDVQKKLNSLDSIKDFCKCNGLNMNVVSLIKNTKDLNSTKQYPNALAQLYEIFYNEKIEFERFFVKL